MSCRKYKATLWKQVCKSNEVLLGLSNFGSDANPPQSVPQWFAMFVAEAYCCKTKLNNTSLLHQARVSLFKTLSSRKRDEEIDKCRPPTEMSLVPHVQRSAYQTFISRQCCSSSPVIPSPTAFGWVDEDGQMQPTKLFVVDTQLLDPGNDDNSDSDELLSSDNDSIAALK